MVHALRAVTPDTLRYGWPQRFRKMARDPARGPCARRRARAMATWALCLAVLPAAAAEQRMYLQFAAGGHMSEDVTVRSRSNDRASVCDEYINPRAVTVAGCTSPDRGAGDGWLAPFDAGNGFSGEAELGFRLSPRFRVAAVIGREATGFRQTVSSTDASGADFDKIGNELAVGEETLGTVVSRELFVMVMHDWPNRTRWTPYVGAGVGVAQPRADFAWLWARSPDPEDIATGEGLANAAEIRRNLAGTVSTGRRTLRDTLRGYALVAGVDRALSDSLSVGLKLRFKRFEAFEPGAYTGDLLRSHVPNLRLDGSEPVAAWSRTGDTGRFTALITVRFTR